MSRLAGVVLAAGAYAVACPPTGWGVAAWIVPGLLLTAVRGVSPTRAFALGVPFSFTLGWGITSWLHHASLAYFGFDGRLASAFAVGVWIGYGVVPFGLLLAAWAWLEPRVSSLLRPWLGAWLWVAMEVTRTHLFTGLPWELLGHTQYRHLLVAQIADLGGVYAVSFVVALVSLSLAEVVSAGPDRLVAQARALAPAAVTLAAVLGYGMVAEHAVAVPPDAGPMVKVAIIQGNIANEFRWKRAYVERNLGIYTRLTTRATGATPDLIVWPENAIDVYLDREPLVRSQIEPLAGRARWGLLTGGPRRVDDGSARNSAYLVGASGGIAGVYDKRRLVPFAEYDPLGDPFGSRRGSDPDEPVYAPGTTDAPLPAGPLRLGTTICYEVLFPGLVAEMVRGGANLLVNLANDSWLDAGDGAAPDQHLSMVVFRAIETRRYLVRAAATGASAVVDPTGTIVDRIARGTAGTMIADVRPRSGRTAYVRWGDWWIVAAGALIALTARVREGAR